MNEFYCILIIKIIYPEINLKIKKDFSYSLNQYLYSYIYIYTYTYIQTVL